MQPYSAPQSPVQIPSVTTVCRLCSIKGGDIPGESMSLGDID